MAASKARNDRPPHLHGDAAHRLGIRRGGDGETGLDDIDAQRIELTRKLELFRRTQREARRLLAVTQCGVENLYLFLSHANPPGRSRAVLQ